MTYPDYEQVWNDHYEQFVVQTDPSAANVQVQRKPKSKTVSPTYQRYPTYTSRYRNRTHHSSRRQSHPHQVGRSHHHHPYPNNNNNHSHRRQKPHVQQHPQYHNHRQQQQQQQQQYMTPHPPAEQQQQQQHYFQYNPSASPNNSATASPNRFDDDILMKKTGTWTSVVTSPIKIFDECSPESGKKKGSNNNNKDNNEDTKRFIVTTSSTLSSDTNTTPRTKITATSKTTTTTTTTTPSTAATTATTASPSPLRIHSQDSWSVKLDLLADIVSTQPKTGPLTSSENHMKKKKKSQEDDPQDTTTTLSPSTSTVEPLPTHVLTEHVSPSASHCKDDDDKEIKDDDDATTTSHLHQNSPSHVSVQSPPHGQEQHPSHHHHHHHLAKKVSPITKNGKAVIPASPPETTNTPHHHTKEQEQVKEEEDELLESSSSFIRRNHSSSSSTIPSPPINPKNNRTSTAAEFLPSSPSAVALVPVAVPFSPMKNNGQTSTTTTTNTTVKVRTRPTTIHSTIDPDDESNSPTTASSSSVASAPSTPTSTNTTTRTPPPSKHQHIFRTTGEKTLKTATIKNDNDDSPKVDKNHASNQALYQCQRLGDSRNIRHAQQPKEQPQGGHHRPRPRPRSTLPPQDSYYHYRPANPPSHYPHPHSYQGGERTPQAYAAAQGQHRPHHRSPVELDGWSPPSVEIQPVWHLPTPPSFRPYPGHDQGRTSTTSPTKKGTRRMIWHPYSSSPPPPHTTNTATTTTSTTPSWNTNHLPPSAMLPLSSSQEEEEQGTASRAKTASNDDVPVSKGKGDNNDAPQVKKNRDDEKSTSSVSSSKESNTSPSTTKSEQQQDEEEDEIKQWDSMLERLAQFKKKHGTLILPTKTNRDPELGKWITAQRRLKGSLSKRRKAALENLGFQWSTQVSWDEMFQRLLCYKQSQGDCLVPNRYNVDPKLGYWVSDQRKRKAKLAQSRIDRLESIGFKWRADKMRHAGNWHAMYEKLQAYKALNGDCRVPQFYPPDPKLRNWVDNQRKRKNKLTQERKDLLDKIEFPWSASERDVWEVMFKKLEQYKVCHGDCLVPPTYKRDTKLSAWVREQCKNRHDIPPGRRRRLDYIGFDWSLDEEPSISSPRRSPGTTENGQINHESMSPLGTLQDHPNTQTTKRKRNEGTSESPHGEQNQHGDHHHHHHHEHQDQNGMTYHQSFSYPAHHQSPHERAHRAHYSPQQKQLKETLSSESSNTRTTASSSTYMEDHPQQHHHHQPYSPHAYPADCGSTPLSPSKNPHRYDTHYQYPTPWYQGNYYHHHHAPHPNYNMDPQTQYPYSNSNNNNNMK